MDWRVIDMAMFCVPPNLVEKLKKSALKGEVDVQQLLNMSSKDRRAFFSKHTNDSLGKLINTEFEKAIISNQKKALTDWAISVFKPQAKRKTEYKSVLDKINSLDEIGALDPKSQKEFLEDLVASKLGLSPSPDEVRVIATKAKAIDDAQMKLGDNLGNPESLQENIGFFKAKKDMDKYLQDLNPASNLRVATGTIGRGLMLASIKSPILNIGSNIEVGLTEAIARRLSGSGLRGADRQLARDYVKMVGKIYKETGYDISRMMSLSDSGASGARVLDDVVHSGGPGAIRKTGRVVEDIVFNKLMGAPDSKFGALHFADSVNTNAFKMAGGDRARARAIMQDAMLLEPKTADGLVLRNQGIMDAQYATWTNESWASKMSLGIRKVLNDLSGDIRVGDYVMPFVKTPANVISTGLDYAGLGIPKALVTMIKAIKTGQLKDREVVQSMARDMVRGGIGLTGAAVIAANISPENFVGAYDPKRKQIEALRNSNSNSVKIGDTWVSLDWFGPFAGPLTGMLYAKKYGKDPASAAYKFAEGAGSSVFRLPAIETPYELITAAQENQDKSLDEAGQTAFEGAVNDVAGRFVPSIFSDIARALDPSERKSSNAIEGIQAKIPGLREQLPVKKNVFGEDVKAEDPLSRILFGSRVKSAKDDGLIRELERLSTANDTGVKFTDWNDSKLSGRIAKFKSEVGGEKFEEAAGQYGSKLRNILSEIVSRDDYADLADDQKLSEINKADQKITDEIFRKYNYKPEKQQKAQTGLGKFIKGYSLN